MYLRGLENEDLSYFIKSVAFTLHESFAEPVRGQRRRKKEERTRWMKNGLFSANYA